MAVNKVVIGDTTLIDLTADDVTVEDVVSGKKFHDRTGEQRVGSLNNAVANLYRAASLTKRVSHMYSVVKELDVEPVRTVSFSKEVVQ